MASNDNSAATKPAENNGIEHLERSFTAGAHVNDISQIPLPVVHRNFANPSPLGLIAFATGSCPPNLSRRTRY